MDARAAASHRAPHRGPAARRRRRQRQDLGARGALRPVGAQGRHRRLGDAHDHLHREGGGRAARPDPGAAARAGRARRRHGGPRAPSSRPSTASAPGSCASTRWPPGSTRSSRCSTATNQSPCRRRPSRPRWRSWRTGRVAALSPTSSPTTPSGRCAPPCWRSTRSCARPVSCTRACRRSRCRTPAPPTSLTAGRPSLRRRPGRLPLSWAPSPSRAPGCVRRSTGSLPAWSWSRAGEVWPVDLERGRLPRNGAALSTDACARYTAGARTLPRPLRHRGGAAGA